MEYNENDYEYNEYQPQEGGGSAKGWKIMVGVLIAVLIALTVVHFQKVQQQRAEFQVEQDTLQNRLTALMGQMGDLQVENDTINAALSHQRYLADSIMGQLKNERNWNLRKVRQYERELSTLRTAMQGFVHQIDSLNRINYALAQENLGMKRQMASYEQRALMAEETATELGNKVKKGSQIHIRDIAPMPLDKREKATNRAKNVHHLHTNFVMTANDLATLGERTVYVRITTPDDAVLGSVDKGTFTYGGNLIAYTAKRAVDYQGEDLPVTVYYDVTGLYPGQYTVWIYVDGYAAGHSDIVLR